MPKEKKEEKKIAYGRTVRNDGNVALTILCHPEQDQDILEFFDKNTAVTYIAKEAIRAWMREQEKRHTPIMEQQNVLEMLQTLLKNNVQVSSSQTKVEGFSDVAPKQEEPKAVLTEEASLGKANFLNNF